MHHRSCFLVVCFLLLAASLPAQAQQRSSDSASRPVRFGLLAGGGGFGGVTTGFVDVFLRAMFDAGTLSDDCAVLPFVEAGMGNYSGAQDFGVFEADAGASLVTRKRFHFPIVGVAYRSPFAGKTPTLGGSEGMHTAVWNAELIGSRVFGFAGIGWTFPTIMLEFRYLQCVGNGGQNAYGSIDAHIGFLF